MIPKTLADIAADDLNKLVLDGEPEGRRLEFKRELPGDSESDKNEFCADVSAFANAGGGDLIFGITENNGIAAAAEGMLRPDPDADILRLEGILNTRLDPRISGVRIRAIPGLPKGHAILIRIPKSWDAPHMVKTNSRFFVRNNASKYPMDVRQIRDAFEGSAAVTQKIERFVHARLGRIVADETPVHLNIPSRFILHFLPLASFEPGFVINLEQVKSKADRLRGGDQLYDRFNFDGRLHYGPERDARSCTGYTQIFRNGSIESLDTRWFREYDAGGGKRPWLIAEQAQSLAIGATSTYLDVLPGLGVEPPYYVVMSLVGFRGYGIYDQRTVVGPRGGSGIVPCEHEQLLLPEVLFDASSLDPKGLFRPAFDALWQASGYERCLNYDEAGIYKPRH